MKSLLFGLAIGIAGLFPAQASHAQQDTEVRVAGELIKAWMNLIGLAVLASDICRVEVGDVGQKAVRSIDRRYQRCVSEKPGWAALPAYMQLSTGAASQPSEGIGSRALAAFLRSESAGKAKSDGGQAFCSTPWKQVLLPEVTDEQTARLRGLPKTMEVVRVIADYERWGEAPCDSFFPPSLGSK